MEEQRILPAVVIKTDKQYYLYPKKRGKSQCLVELDEMGYLFWNLVKEEKKIENVIRRVCEQYGIEDIGMKKQVSNDVENFYKMINEINVYTEVAKENVGEVIDNNVSERSFTEQFAKRH